jgi:hypothetical protein
VCWLHDASVLKRDSFHPRISPMRSVFSRLSPKCNQPCVQVCLVFTCYAHDRAVRQCCAPPRGNTSGAATSTPLLVWVDSCLGYLSEQVKRDGTCGSYDAGYGGDLSLNRGGKHDANTHHGRWCRCSTSICHSCSTVDCGPTSNRL